MNHRQVAVKKGEEMSLQATFSYSEPLTGEAKVKMAERALDVLKMQGAPGVVLETGERIAPQDLIAQSISMGERFVSYTMKPKMGEFERIARDEINRMGGVEVYFKRDKKWIAYLLTKLAIWALSKDRNIRKELADATAKDLAERIASDHFIKVSGFFHANFEGVSEAELQEALHPKKLKEELASHKVVKPTEKEAN